MAIRRYAGVVDLLLSRALIFVAQPQSATLAEQHFRMRGAAVGYCEQRRPGAAEERHRSDPPATSIAHSWNAAPHHQWVFGQFKFAAGPFSQFSLPVPSRPMRASQSVSGSCGSQLEAQDSDPSAV